ncbi:MAG: ABC transporter permease [Alphaproteobacteria bacterium]|nr:ABC transporter permease [Alphaproteobacteria bacterium]
MAAAAPKRRWYAQPGVRAVLPVAAILLVFVVAAIAAPWIAPLDPARQSLLARLRAPGTTVGGITYWFGSDELGRDLLSRVIYGARASLTVALLSVVVSGAVGTALGVLAGYFRGWTEIAIMRAVDIMLSIPAILLAIITVAVLGPGFFNLVIVLGFTRWPRYTRVAYAQTLSVSTRPFITASRLAGARPLRILARHVLPNILAPLIVVATLEFGLMVLFEAGLSFLGLGIQPPTPSWGSIMSVGRNYVATAWWIATFPGICLFLLVLSVNLVGDFLRDRFDPRSNIR